MTGDNIKSYKYNGEYQSDKSTYTLSKYIRNNNFVLLTDKNGKESKITCSTTMEALPVIKPTGKIVKKAETETLKIYVENHSQYYLSYVWAKDPLNQLNKQMIPDNSKELQKPLDIMNSAIKEQNLQNKYILAFNASAMVGKLSDSMWPGKYLRGTVYYHKEKSALLLYNGKVVINDYKNYRVKGVIYYIDGSNQLNYIPNLKNKTASERKQIFQDVIDDGARNTFRFGIRLINNYNKTKLTKNSEARKQAFCQIDTNNFVLFTSKNGKQNEIHNTEVQNAFKKIGCRLAFRLDGGGSTTLYFKSNSKSKLTKNDSLSGGGRKNSTMMYFTELN